MRRSRRKGSRVTLHARERAAERYGLDLTHADVIALGRRVETWLRGITTSRVRDNVRLIEKANGFQPRVTVAVRFNRAWLAAIYAPQLRQITTFLPRDRVPTDLLLT